jgi:hypothetical protein
LLAAYARCVNDGLVSVTGTGGVLGAASRIPRSGDTSTSWGFHTVNKTVVSMLAAAALVGAGALPAQAEGKADPGEARASVLRTDLEVGLLNKTVDVPLATSLNEVRAPQGDAHRAGRTALTAEVDGAEHDRPFSVLKAEVAEAQAEAGDERTAAHVTLAHARLHLPGLPFVPLLDVEQVTSSVECPVGGKPTAKANVLGTVTVLGKRTRLTAGGPTLVEVPEVGKVSLELSGTQVTDDTAAASALKLSVHVDPLHLGVAEVDGTVTVAGVSCRTPQPAPDEDGTTPQTTQPKDTEPAAHHSPAAEVAGPALAETGGSPVLPYLAGGAALLLGAGGALLFARRSGRGRSSARH